MNEYKKSKFGKFKRGRKGVILICQICKKDFYIYPCRFKLGKVKYCSKKCYGKSVAKCLF